jgi:DNA-binding MarR family transcriptional regulator
MRMNMYPNYASGSYNTAANQQGTGKVDTYHQLLIALRRINKATDMDAKRLAKTTGLTTPQLLVMQAISDAASLTVGEVARAINLTVATTTSIVNGLERKGLLVKRRDLTDKRRVIVSPNNDGTRLIQEAPKTLQDLLEQRFNTLESWEQTFVLSALQRVAALMDAADIDASPLLHTGAIDISAEVAGNEVVAVAEPVADRST